MRALGAVAFLLAFLPACRVNEAGETVPDWPAIAVEMELGAADARDAAALFDDESIQEGLVQLSIVLDEAAAAIQAGGEPAGILDVLDRALALADGLVEQLPADSQQDARAGLILVRAVLRRARAYAEVGG